MLFFPSWLSRIKALCFRAFVYFSPETSYQAHIFACLSPHLYLHVHTLYFPCIKSSSYNSTLYKVHPSLSYHTCKTLLPTTCRASLPFRIQVRIKQPWWIWRPVPAWHLSLFTMNWVAWELVKSKSLQTIKMHLRFLHLIGLFWFANEDLISYCRQGKIYSTWSTALKILNHEVFIWKHCF